MKVTKLNITAITLIIIGISFLFLQPALTAQIQNNGEFKHINYPTEIKPNTSFELSFWIVGEDTIFQGQENPPEITINSNWTELPKTINLQGWNPSNGDYISGDQTIQLTSPSSTGETSITLNAEISGQEQTITRQKTLPINIVPNPTPGVCEVYIMVYDSVLTENKKLPADAETNVILNGQRDNNVRGHLLRYTVPKQSSNYVKLINDNYGAWDKNFSVEDQDTIHLDAVLIEDAVLTGETDDGVMGLVGWVLIIGGVVLFVFDFLKMKNFF